ncbi:protein pleiotropic regulatory locus 1-like isoform X4 [Carya illinoinensis]|uniref:protein pleiotropic regulatory locus 1-like isoform X4 n=1 Tax=Carya illinoinensis TaxID=32201 RepID=UPI001C71A4B1|nr:protein pleiotropic regulatory locus 1-like isoform X4 [Carya illinoinensis]
MQVWDICIKAQIFALTGHDNTICSVFTRPVDPKLLLALMTQPSSFGTSDSLFPYEPHINCCLAGKTMLTLTHHKKLVRAMAPNPKENCFTSASADNIKKFNLPKGEFLHNMLSQQKTIINAMWLSMWRVCWPQEVTMAVFGSGIGRVITIFSKPKQLYNLAHWIVKLESMLHATT